MEVVREIIGNTELFIQTVDTRFDVINETQDEPAIMNTGIEDDIKEAYNKAKSVLREIASDFGQEMIDVASDVAPKQVQIEFNMAFSGELNAWVVRTKGDYAFKVSMTWGVIG